MRNAFADEITQLARVDERVVLLSADAGNRLFNAYQAQCPARFHNTGIAEANTIGVAAGMAMCGLRPVAYTIAPFITYRCYEQIRVDLCYHRQPVVVVGVGAGLCYSALGATHETMEDLAILRALPNMNVVCPGDAHEVRAALRAALQADGPTYLRLGMKGEPLVHAGIPDLRIGRSINMKPGKDVAILSTGNILPVSMKAAELLAARGIDARVESFHTVKPMDEACLAEVFANCRAVATVEEHGKIGGLGGAVAEWRCRRPDGLAPLLSFGADDRFLSSAGHQPHARAAYGLTAENIAETLAKAL